MTATMVKVSILIPTFNRLKYLREALQSARDQTLRDIEIVVSDDGSSDGTQDFLRQQRAIDDRICIAPPNPRRGLFENVNHLLQSATGEAFCILGDDDRLAPQFAELLHDALAREPSAAVAFCDHDIIDAEGRLLADESRENSARYGRSDLPLGIVRRPELAAIRMSMCMGFSVYRARDFGGERFDLTCGGAADADMALRACRKGNLYYLPQVLGSYRTHPRTATKTRRLFMAEGAISALSRHRLDDPEAEQLRHNNLQNTRLRLLPYLALADRLKMARLFRDYVRDGGSPIRARVAIAGGLALLPHAWANRLWPAALGGEATP